MKKEYVKEILKALKNAGAICNYEDIGSNIFSIDDGYCYIALDRKNQLESNQGKLQARIDILDIEKELENDKKNFKEKYGEDYE